MQATLIAMSRCVGTCQARVSAPQMFPISRQNLRRKRRKRKKIPSESIGVRISCNSTDFIEIARVRLSVCDRKMWMAWVPRPPLWDPVLSGVYGPPIDKVQ